MNPNIDASESSFPLGFIVLPTFVGALVWLCVMVQRLP